MIEQTMINCGLSRKVFTLLPPATTTTARG
jgi:hypothetical protein